MTGAEWRKWFELNMGAIGNESHWLDIIADLEAAEKDAKGWEQTSGDNLKSALHNRTLLEAAESALASRELELEAMRGALEHVQAYAHMAEETHGLVEAALASPPGEFAQRVKAVLQDGIDFWDDEGGGGLSEWREKARALLQAMGGRK